MRKPDSGSDPISKAYILLWDKPEPPSEEEAEAKLHQEGYECFRWHDVPGSEYPKHRHDKDECLWILKGEISLTIQGETFDLKPGDRLYLPSHLPHSAQVPKAKGVTYLVGQKLSCLK